MSNNSPRPSECGATTHHAAPLTGDTHIDRRAFLHAASAAALTTAADPLIRAHPAMSHATMPAPGNTQASEASSARADEPDTSDILVDTIIKWGATHVFGIVGDGINPIIEALRKRKDQIAFVGVRHEEAAAFMASGMGKHTGKLGVCLATTGPGAVHLMNGLYDAAGDNAPVLAITGTTFHDLQGMHFMQSVNTVKLMEDVALFNEQVSGPANALLLVNRACRAALGGKGVAHLAIAKDVQNMKQSADKKSMENHDGRTSSAWTPLATPCCYTAPPCRGLIFIQGPVKPAVCKLTSSPITSDSNIRWRLV